MASMVGSASSFIFRRSAPRLTSCITGSLPYAPVPMTSCLHFQGIFSSADNGVWPNSSWNFFEGFFLRLRISPRSMMTSCSYVLPSIWIDPKENLSKRIGALFSSSAFLRCDSGEDGPALLDIPAATVRADDLAFFVVDEH